MKEALRIKITVFFNRISQFVFLNKNFEKKIIFASNLSNLNNNLVGDSACFTSEYKSHEVI